MTPRDSNSDPEGDWDDFEELGWSEFDWEKYLREQDEVVQRYTKFYEQLEGSENRIDQAAELMGWEGPDADSEEEDDEDDDTLDPDDLEPYTLHRNPVYVAATALYLGLTRSWECLCSSVTDVAPQLAVSMQTSLFRGERHFLLAIQSHDLGDYSMAVSLYKRAMRELNLTLSHLSRPEFLGEGPLVSFREISLPRLFDLREVLLRVIKDCREEAARHSGTSEDDEGGDRKGTQG